jgi:hypothetical protein
MTKPLARGHGSCRVALSFRHLGGHTDGLAAQEAFDRRRFLNDGEFHGSSTRRLSVADRILTPEVVGYSIESSCCQRVGHFFS